MKTIKQIADELGVEKLRVYRYIRRNRINEAYREHQTGYYDDTVESLMWQHFKVDTVSGEALHDRISDTVSDTVISMLRQELDAKNAQLAAKDKQIDDLNARLAEVTAALVGAQDAARAAQALHAGTIQAQLGDGRGGFWAQLFGRNKGK
jgi:AcrR family transcriptional regulator